MSSQTKGLDPVYSSETAAEMLGISLPTLKRHIYQTKILAGFGKMVGRTLVFTDDEISKMRAKLDAIPGRGNTQRSRKQVADRQDKALALHEQKKSLQEIADALKFTDTSGVLRAIRAARKRRDS